LRTFFGVVKCGVCRGISRKTVCRTWCFCGEDVVECVANVVILTVVFRRRKTGHPFKLYFLAGAAGVGNGAVSEKQTTTNTGILHSVQDNDEEQGLA
jgi:hypothetical protein